MKPLAKRIIEFGSKYKTILLIYLLSRIFILVTGIIGFEIIHRDLPEGHSLWQHNTPSESIYLRMWERWDANHYINIARDGYSHSEEYTNLAFFPLYPYSGKLLNYLIGNTTLSLLIISNIAFLFALIFLYKLLSLDYESSFVHKTILYISISPFSLFFFGVYTESLLLLTLVATAYYIRMGNYSYAALWGILLTATKLIGVVIIPFALWEYFSRRREQDWKIDFNILYIPIMLLGLLAFLLHNHIIFDDWLISFSASKAAWIQYINWPWMSFTHHITRLFSGNAFWAFYFDLSFAVLAIYLCLSGLKLIRPSYSLLSISLLLIPFSSNTLKAFPRFMIVIFPLYIVQALICDNNRMHSYFVSFSLFLLALITILFVNFYYIG